MVRLLVVDDNRIVRKMVAEQMRGYPEIELVGEATNGLEAIQMVRQHSPDVLIMDVRMPEMNGIDATRAIMAEHPLPILIFSSFTPDGAPETIAALEAGAVEAILKGGFGENTPVRGALQERVLYWGKQKISALRHHHAPVKAAGTQKGWVQNVRTVGCPNHDDTFC